MNNKLTLDGADYELVQLDTIAGCAEGVPIIFLNGKMFAAKAIVDKRWPVDGPPEQKKEWEVLSFRVGIGVYIKKDNLYVNGGLVCPFVPSAAEILSVKRLSDGEVFSVGDTITANAGCDLTIKSFEINTRNKSFVMVWSAEYGYWPLSDIKKKEKKEWEVLSFTDGGFKFNSVGGGKFKLEYSIIPSMSMPFDNVPNTAQILSVKRLTDGEVFSIGDYVDMINAHKITRIIIGGAPQNSEQDESLVWLSTSADPYNHGVHLMIATKYKPKPIFKTHDGVEYFEGQEKELLFGVVPKAAWETMDEISVRTAKGRSAGSWIWFSSKEAMNDYIFENKPYLSQSEILYFISRQDIITRDQKSGLTLNLRHFLKLKLNGIQ